MSPRRSVSRSIRWMAPPILRTTSRSAPSSRSVRAVTMWFPPSSSPAQPNAPRASWSTVPRPRWCWRTTGASTSLFSTAARVNSCLSHKASGLRPIRRNSPSTRRTGGTGTVRCGPISTNAWPALAATAVPISTCAGSARWSPSHFAFSSAAACSFIRPTRAPDTAKGASRLLYEAHPMALVMEWAGGSATTGRRRILEVSARTPHQRVPLIMGSMRGVRDVAAIHEAHRTDVRQ